MFTGIIEETGTVRRVERGARFALEVRARVALEGLRAGDSVSTNGVCLTVTSFDDAGFRADVMPETARRSNLGGLRVGDAVNLERALALGGRLGGHLVSGHIDGTGRVVSRVSDGNAEWVTVAADAGILRHVVEKGSIAVDGISLTVAAVDGASFKVSLTPFTRLETTLARARPGDTVNLETDLMAKYAEKLLGGTRGGLTLDFLTEHGF
ncbi:MAG: riboflavin synthase [Odoribacteraceae bacterium]|nr:riboflavin synthase [Odoribacteraceae bacterium]